MEVQLNIPDDIVVDLQPPNGDLSRWLLEMIALNGYKSEKLTAHQVQELLGFGTRMEVDGFLKAHGVPLEFTLEDLEQQRAAFNALPSK
jgi:hypothetical protein